jgi:heterodisulfide reductase subunit A
MTERCVGSVLVVGGGIAGMQASLDLADIGFRVYLVERNSYLGGQTAGLNCLACKICSRYFPGNNVLKPVPCGICEFPDLMVNLTHHKNIRILTASETTDVVKNNGTYSVKIKSGTAGDIKKDSEININVGAIILNPGFEQFDARIKKEYGYGVFKKVLTGVEYEKLIRISDASGSGLPQATDGTAPKRIAFVLCVGSRDEKTNLYCSTVCCQASIKQAIMTSEKYPGSEIWIFYMDIRTIAKGAEQYYTKAVDAHKIKFVRARVAEIIETPDTGNLVLRYSGEDGTVAGTEFDLVVLGTGLVPPRRVSSVFEKLGAGMENEGFFRADDFRPLETGVRGIFVAGTITGPKDIPDSIAQGSGAAAKVAAHLLANGFIKSPDDARPCDKGSGEPKIGVFVCDILNGQKNALDIPRLLDHINKMPGVVYSEQCAYSLKTIEEERIAELIKIKGINRIIFASCGQTKDEQLFKNAMSDAGLNAFLLEVFDIYDECCCVHGGNTETVTGKAIELMQMHLARAKLLEPLESRRIPVERASAMVIGGGVAGMTAALDIAEQGFEVDIVEKSDGLGGLLRNMHHVLDNDIKKQLSRLVDQVKSNNKIRVHLHSEIERMTGSAGNFEVLVNGEKTETIKCAVIVVATGATELQPDEYLFGRDTKVLTQLQFEKAISGQTSPAPGFNRVVMIQCVGSREQDRDYCSRVCCLEALKNALLLKKINPQAEITILYRDIRSYGLGEKYYRLASETGVNFINYDAANKPRVSASGDALTVTVYDNIHKENVTLDTDLVVLSAAVVPNPVKSLAGILRIPLDEHGFFMEAHTKLKPVETIANGIFACGTALAPKNIGESISQGSAAAAKAGVILSRGYIEAGGMVAVVDPDKCSICLTCVRTCPFEAPSIDKKHVAEIDKTKCRGCGMCVAACPAKAIKLGHYTDAQIVSGCVALTEKLGGESNA